MRLQAAQQAEVARLKVENLALTLALTLTLTLTLTLIE